MSEALLVRGVIDMDEDTKEMLAIFGGCALIGGLAIVGTIWGIVAALKWAFS